MSLFHSFSHEYPTVHISCFQKSILPPFGCWFIVQLLVMSDSLQTHGLQHARVPILTFSISHGLLRFTSLESVTLSNHLILYLLLLLLPSIFPRIRDFSDESTLCIRWLKYWSFSFSISPSNGYSGLISFRIDWFDLLAVQVFSSITVRKHQFFSAQPLLQIELCFPRIHVLKP